MNVDLYISDDLAIPIRAVTEKQAHIGKTGSGKSYGAMKMAELMYHGGGQFVALDPKGDWHGLRTSADGQHPGLPIYIFGGAQGDIAIASGDGAAVARAIVELAASAVVDLSGFDADDEVQEFAIGFGRELFNLKKKAPSAIHLFLEEAETFVPQDARGRDYDVLREYNRIWKIGRSYGIGGSLVSQRPQDIAKKALSQTELLFAYQLPGALERKAISAWTKGMEGAENIYEILPRLENGSPFVFSPQWLNVAKVIRINERETFDAGTTPEVGAAPVVRTVAAVEVEKLRAVLGKGDDRDDDDHDGGGRAPVVVQGYTEAQLAAEVERATAPLQERIALLDHLIHEGAEISRRLMELFSDTVTIGGFIRQRDSLDIPKELHVDRTSADVQLPPKEETKVPEVETEGAITETNPAPEATPEPVAKGPNIISTPSSGSRETLSASQQRILDALATFEELGVDQVRKDILAVFAEASPKSSSYDNNLSHLRRIGYVDYPASGFIALEAQGRIYATGLEAPPTLAAFQDRWLGILSPAEAKIARVLVSKDRAPIGKAELAGLVGASAASSAYENNLSRLRKLGVLDYPAKGMIAATELLFPERLT